MPMPAADIGRLSGRRVPRTGSATPSWRCRHSGHPPPHAVRALTIAASPAVAALFREPTSAAPRRRARIAGRIISGDRGAPGDVLMPACCFRTRFDPRGSSIVPASAERWGYPTSGRGLLLTRRSPRPRRGEARHQSDLPRARARPGHRLRRRRTAGAARFGTERASCRRALRAIPHSSRPARRRPARRRVWPGEAVAARSDGGAGGAPHHRVRRDVRHRGRAARSSRGACDRILAARPCDGSGLRRGRSRGSHNDWCAGRRARTVRCLRVQRLRRHASGVVAWTAGGRHFRTDRRSGDASGR